MIEPGSEDSADPIEEEVAPHHGRGKGKKSSLTGNLMWTVLRMGGVGLVQFVVLFVVSHQLTRVEVGWSANITAVSYLAQLLAFMGVAPALIQRPKITDEHLATGIIVSVVTGLLQTALVIVAAGPIANLYHTPEIVPYLRVTSLVFAFMAVSRVAMAIIERELRFNKTAKTELISAYVYGIVTIIGVYAGLQLWGVVIGLLAQALSKSILLFKGERVPRPFRFSWVAYRDLMSVGTGFSIATVLSYIASNADNLVVSRYLGAEPVAVYSRAFQLMARPAGMLAKSISLVLYPTMARSQDNRRELQSLFERTTAGMAVLVMPVGVVCSVLGPEIVRVILGPKWPDVVLPFQILGAGMYFRVGNQASDSMTLAVGETAGRVVPKTIYAICVAAFAYIGSQWGIIGVSWGIFLANAVHTLLMTQQCLKHIDLGWWGYVRAHQSAFLVSAIGAVVAWFVASAMRPMHLPLLTLIVAMGLSAATGLAVLYRGGPGLLGTATISIRDSLVSALKRKVKKNKKGAGPQQVGSV